MKFFQFEEKKERIFGLDIIRFFAILFVLIGHSENLLPEKLKIYNTYFYTDGVNIFFVLSGFLIGKNLIENIKNNQFNFKFISNFYVKRWAKTIPSYFLILSVLLSLNLIFNEHFKFDQKYNYFIFLQNFNTVHPSFFPEAWSLSIEEWFYLLIPIIFFISLKISSKFQNNRIILYSLIAIITVFTFYRIYRLDHLHILNYMEWDRFFRKQVITRFDSIVYGVIAAYIYKHHYSLWISNKKTFFFIGIFTIILAKILSLFFVSEIGFYNCVFSFTLLALGTAFTLPYLNNFQTNRNLIYKIITYVSITSYSMYLVNLSIIKSWIINKINWEDIFSNYYMLISLRYLLFWLLVILFSYILYNFVEFPLNKIIKKRFNVRK